MISQVDSTSHSSLIFPTAQAFYPPNWAGAGLIRLASFANLWLNTATMPHIVTIEKLVFGGQGLAHLNGKVAFVWNALPGEEVEIEILHGKKDLYEAVTTKILKPSPERVEPREAHFLSSAPWQMLDWDRENYWKKAIAMETYGKVGGLILQQDPPKIASDDRAYGYRNKIEFSFAEKEDGTKSLAFFVRGKNIRMPIDGSELAEPVINAVAKDILAWINEQQIPMRSLKSLIVRSNGEGQAIAALFIKDELPFSSFPKAHGPLVGFQLYYSTHKSPASVPTKLMHSDGQDYLVANLKSTKLKFGLLSFFQINIPVFDEALTDIATFMHPKMPLLDFYSGVGAIGLSLSHNRDELTLVDSNEEAIQYAKENIELNGRTNTEAICLPAEKITDVITGDKQLIVDPPRAGLHHKVVSTILQRQPPRIAYLSCDLATQARDIRLLSEAYKVTFIKLYNFFPRTPHIEGLCILDKM